jgi:hypothetical protein
MAFLKRMFGTYDVRKLRAEGDVKGLIEALSHAKAGGVRWDAADALEEIGDAQAVEALIGALRDEDARVRRSAVRALGTIGDARAVQPLSEALKRSSRDDKARIAWALTDIGDTQAMKPVLAALRDLYGADFFKIVMRLGRIATQLEDTGIYPLVVKAMVRRVWDWLPDGQLFFMYERTPGISVDYGYAKDWFNTQSFFLPVGMGDEFVAKYCFDMAYQAQTSGNMQEAWAGYYQALERLTSENEKMAAITCWRLGQVHAARNQPDMASMFFIHSAYLSQELDNRQGYAWALYDLGHSFKDLGAKYDFQSLSAFHHNFRELSRDHSDFEGVPAVVKYVWMEALNVFRETSPDDAVELEELIRGLGEDGFY